MKMMEGIKEDETNSIMLTVLIICHNQKDVLKRCIDSALQQKTTFPTEVIVSDDRSNDGTREMLVNEYKNKVISTLFDSDTCNTSFTLERAGYNRLNGLRLARGKYIIHTDGDDFFTSTDLFQTMVDTLEEHPECSLCCQNYCILDSNNIDAPHVPQIKDPIMFKDSIVSPQFFFSKVMLVNACFCARRGSNFNSENLWGGTYDDNYITARYIGNGMIAILNRCDFVYVQYDHSSCANLSAENKKILFQPAIGSIELAPSIAGVMLRRYTDSFFVVSKHAVFKKHVNENLQSFCSKFESFIYHNLDNNNVFRVWLRYLLIFLLTLFMRVTKLKTRLLLILLYRLSIGKLNEKVII